MFNRVRIVRLTGAEAEARGYIPGIENVFFATAARVYPAGAERMAFRERWLGRFLDNPADPLLLALGPEDEVAGYLVGTLENAAESPRFADMPHFREVFSGQCASYPAHLHINLAAPYRGAGVGSALIDRFAQIVRAAGLPGLHVTTGQGMRNVRFYLANGFHEAGSWSREGGVMLFLGRPL